MNTHLTNVLQALVPNSSATERSVTVADSAVDIGSLHARTDVVLVTAGAYPVRYSIGGLTPTASEGHYLAAGDSVLLGRVAADALQVIRATSDSSTVCVTELCE